MDDLIIGPDGMVKKIVFSILRRNLGKDRVSVPYKPFEVTYWGLAYDVSMEELRELPEHHYQEGR